MNDLEQSLLTALARKDYVPANVPELLRLLQLPPDQQQTLQTALRQLEQRGAVARIKGNCYIQPQTADLIPGRIRMNRQGKGFLQPDDTNLKEIAIPESATGTALHEDRVLVRREVRSRGLRAGESEADTGSVVRILERRRTTMVGTLQRGRQFLYVIPDDPRIPHDIYVPEPRDVGRRAQVGDKVVVELREWESRHTNPEGEIIEVLGAADAEGVDMLSVLRQYDLPLSFPKPVLAEARAIGTTVAAPDLDGRVDCRRHPVVTIDPDDAKDFDDAICLERGSPEQWRLWVHIADVSHYVKPGTALDAEARKRGNSTYLVDRVIPMLPEALSNELCSLKPDVDRLTKCVEFLISNDGRVLNAKFYPAVIHSQRRFTYGEVLAILNGKPQGPIEQMLHQTHQLAQRIRRRRFQAGSLDLDFPESKIRLDDKGHILRIEKTVNDVSHQLIEECMLLANEAVAARLMSLRRPAIYRIHEPPDDRRLQEYRQDVLSHNVPCGNLTHPAEVQKLLQRLNTLPIGSALKIGFLKSLMRARYAVEPLGHYGLAKAKYTHFTSPIRRYADLVVHRALFDTQPASAHALKEAAEHISVTERNSADAERDSKDVKLFAFLRAQLVSGHPEAYPALVTDVRNFGFFVDVSGLAMSGLVPLSTVQDDFFIFEPARNHLIGRRTRRIIRLGDQVTVQVAKVDTYKKQVDFRLVQVPKQPVLRRLVAPRNESQRRPQQSDQSQRRPQPSDQPSRRPQPSDQSQRRPQPSGQRWTEQKPVLKSSHRPFQPRPDGRRRDQPQRRPSAADASPPLRGRGPRHQPQREPLPSAFGSAGASPYRRDQPPRKNWQASKPARPLDSGPPDQPLRQEASWTSRPKRRPSSSPRRSW